MDRDRYLELTSGAEALLTEEELAQGWRFCCEWDWMLINGDDPEAECCTCITTDALGNALSPSRSEITVVVVNKENQMNVHSASTESEVTAKAISRGTTIGGLLRVLTTPGCWLQNERYSAQWDTMLNDLMWKYHFTEIGRHEATIGRYVVWIANHPYASFTMLGRRPKRITILRAMDRLEADLFNHKVTALAKCNPSDLATKE